VERWNMKCSSEPASKGGEVEHIPYIHPIFGEYRTYFTSPPFRVRAKRLNNSPKTQSGKGKSCPASCQETNCKQQLWTSRTALRTRRLTPGCFYVRGKPSRGAIAGAMAGRSPSPSACQTTGGNPGFPTDPFPEVCRIGLKHAQDVALSAYGKRAKRKAVQCLGTRPLPHVLTCSRCHGARVAPQRCPILRDILTIAKSPPFLQDKTNNNLTKLTNKN
jgi:hypothetical protein